MVSNHIPFAAHLVNRIIGVVDYISDSGSTGFDRALQLAEKIASNGACKWRLPQPLSHSQSAAPLALRAAKQAISRAVDLPLESGRHFSKHARHAAVLASLLTI